MITFTGVDFFTQVTRAEGVLRGALATAMRVPVDDVDVIGEHSNRPISLSRVQCRTYAVSGDFAVLASIQAAPLVLDYDSSVDVVSSLSHLLDVVCLVPDEQINPYTFWLCRPDTGRRRVSLDPRAMENEIYILTERDALRWAQSDS